MIKNVKYLIIGAGISGLAFASSKKYDDYLILEKESEPGGYCRTVKRNNFVWDYAGHFFHFRTQELRQEFDYLLHNESAVFQTKQTGILYKGNHIDYPFQFNIHQLPKDEFIDCLVDLFNKHEVEGNTFKKMLYTKFGKGISERFLIPYNEKLYACDLDNLDSDAMGRFFPMADAVQIVQSFRKSNIGTYNDSFYYSSDGAIAFVNEFLKKLDEDRIMYNCEPDYIDMENKVVYVGNEEIRYEYLINSMPFDLLLNTARVPHKNCFSANQVLVFNIGFDSDSQDSKSHWLYFPENKYIFYRVGFYNNILRRQPMSLYVEIGYPQDVQVDVDTAFKQTLADLKKAGIIAEQKPVDWCHMIMNPGYVHISKESQEEKARIMNEMEKKQAYSIGRYGAWTYCSIEDCIVAAYSLAKEI